MNPELATIIERARKRKLEPGLRNIQGRYRFDVEGAGTWRLHVDNGVVELLDGPGEADCIVSVDADDFVLIASGKQNLVTAYMQGRVDIEGDMVLAQALASLTHDASQEQGSGHEQEDER